MTNKKFTRFLSTFLTLVLVLSLVLPFAGTADAALLKQPFKPNPQDESILQQKAAIAQQTSLLEGDARLHKDLEGLSGTQKVPVIIHLSEKSVGLEQGIQKLNGKKMTQAQKNTKKKKIQDQQVSAKKKMAVKNVKFDQQFSYDTVLNGLSGTVQANDLEKILDIDEVKYVEPDTTMYALEGLEKVEPSVDAQMDTSIPFLGIDKLWAEGIEGQGIKVAVLDTGIDAEHPDLKAVYKGGKNFVPHTEGDYARPRADDDGSETSPLDRPSNKPEFNDKGSAFYTSHGTHVAGTIAAQGNNPYGIKGIAPKVDLYSYRVLGAYGSGSTAGIIKAIDTAVIENMDVINLSLGGGANNEVDGASFAINNAMLAGTISVIATGNSGPNRGTMGTPATSRLGIGVGNTTNPETHYQANINITAGDFTYSKVNDLMATTFGKDVKQQLSGSYKLVAVPGVGKEADYAGLDVKGKIALVSRGEIAFVDKIEAAKKNGAVGVIVHNFAGGTNAPGKSQTFLGDAFEFLPTFDMSVTDGEAIRAALAAAEGTITFDQFTSTKTTGDDVNDSSSRGPSVPNFDIKPDVTAPGTNIMSTIPQYGKDFPDADYSESYSRKTGTSMATPHVAGIAALVKQANPEWNAFDVKVALSNTATLLDTKKYDVFTQGAGRVEAYKAAHADVLAYGIDTANNDGSEVENLKGTVTFGPQKLDKDISVTKQIKVKDLKGKGGDYTVSVDITKKFGDANVTVDKTAFTLNGEQMLNVTLTASKAESKAGDEILGYIHIKGNGKDLSLPFAADFGGAAAAAVTDMEITETDLSFNGDGVKDEAMLYFTITGDVNFNTVELWNIMDPTGGEYNDGYIGYLHAGASLAAGSYQLPIKGEYTPWGGTGQQDIPDGLYTIDFTGEPVSGNPKTITADVGPVVVKSSAGTIEGSVENGKAAGKVIDKYVDYQRELVKYGMGYDLNTKLSASYEVTTDGKAVNSGAVKLDQDGNFAFDVPNFDKYKSNVTVKYTDAAGNKAAQEIYKAEGQPDTVSVSVDQTALDLKAGDTAQILVTETTTKPDGTSTDRDVTAEADFASSDAAVATVANGKVTAVAAGKADITITYGDFTQTIPVTVTADAPAQDEVTYALNKKNLSIGVGQQEQLLVTETTVKADGTTVKKDITPNVKFNVVDNSIATVSKGLVTGHKAGKTQVRVMIPGQDTRFVYLEVNAAEQDVVTYSVDKNTLKLGVGQQEQITVTKTTVKPDGTVVEQDFTPNTSFNIVNNKIATVHKGLVTAQKAGKTQVRVMIPEQDTIFVYLEVVAPKQDIVTYSVDKTEVKMQVNQQKQIKVTQKTVKPDGQIIERDATNDAKFSVVNNKIATVHKGLISAHQPGKTQVKVDYPNGETTLVYLTVKGEPAPVVTYALDKDSVSLKEGDTASVQLIETTTKADGTSTTKSVTDDAAYQSNNPSVAKVFKGKITAIGAGDAEISVTLGDFTTTVNVHVEKPASKAMVVTEDMIASFLNDKKAKEIILDVPAADGTFDVELDDSVLKAIEKSKKYLVFKTADAAFTFEKDAVEVLRKNTNGKAVVTFGKSSSAQVKGAKSDIYTIGINQGTAAAKTAIKKFGEDIQVAIAVDDSADKKWKKGSVLNLDTNKTSKYKVKKGQAEFEIESAGSYVLLDK
ncbi:S8 family serine peptidase [Sporosarcina trichiuri]|uniref:S8 family serine peptidase n=1 Tax=Sporosarcina trichiuri TaxID=3056445 RepID=UPI0025B41739|nr:S8 family serine peptidase [Sporosarcina sp. 0.2-SM1T-5]WJY26476.1 S8 family serine peptidase [Sporosarcina sp. 0.2-SM1T-5]